MAAVGGTGQHPLLRVQSAQAADRRRDRSARGVGRGAAGIPAEHPRGHLRSSGGSSPRRPRACTRPQPASSNRPASTCRPHWPNGAGRCSRTCGTFSSSTPLRPRSSRTRFSPTPRRRKPKSLADAPPFVDHRTRGADQRAPVPRAAVGPADHGLLPHRPPVRRAGRLPAGENDARRRPRHRPRPDPACLERADPAPGTAGRQEERQDHRRRHDHGARSAHHGLRPESRRLPARGLRPQLPAAIGGDPDRAAAATTTSSSTAPMSAGTTPSSSTRAPTTSSTTCGRRTACTCSTSGSAPPPRCNDGDHIRICDHEFTFQINAGRRARDTAELFAARLSRFAADLTRICDYTCGCAGGALASWMPDAGGAVDIVGGIAVRLVWRISDERRAGLAGGDDVRALSPETAAGPRRDGRGLRGRAHRQGVDGRASS